MRMIIEARIVSGSGSGSKTEKVISLADFERCEVDLKQLGLNLSEGRDLMHRVQQVLITAQTQCRHCWRVKRVDRIGFRD